MKNLITKSIFTSAMMLTTIPALAGSGQVGSADYKYTCVENVCLGQKVYEYHNTNGIPSEVVGFRGRGTPLTGDVAKDLPVALIKRSSDQVIDPNDFREVYLDAGSDACVAWKTNAKNKVCVGDTISISPNIYEIQNKAVEKISSDFIQKNGRLATARVEKVLKFSDKVGVRVDKVVLSSTDLNLNSFAIEASGIALTNPDDCIFSGSFRCVGDSFKTYYGEDGTIEAVLPGDEYQQGKIYASSLQGLTSYQRILHPESYKSLQDPKFLKASWTDHTQGVSVRVKKDTTNAEGRKLMAAKVIEAAKESCGRTGFNRSILDEAKSGTPVLTQCYFDHTDYETVAHGLVTRRTERRYWFNCNTEMHIACKDKGL